MTVGEFDKETEIRQETDGSGMGIDASASVSSTPDEFYVVSVGLFLGSALANFSLPIILRHASVPHWDDTLMFFLIGTLVAQCAMLSTWTALGTWQLSSRIGVCSCMAFMLCICWLLGLRVQAGMPVPFWGFSIVLTLGLGGMLLGAAGLAAWAFPTGMRISRQVSNPRQEKRGYSIGYVLIVTASIAAMTATLKLLLPAYDENLPPPSFVNSMVVISGLQIFVAILFTIGCIQLVLGTASPFARGIWLLAAIVCGLTLTFGYLFVGSTFNSFPRQVYEICVQYLGFIVSLMSALSLYRLLGFRLLKSCDCK